MSRESTFVANSVFVSKTTCTSTRAAPTYLLRRAHRLRILSERRQRRRFAIQQLRQAPLHAADFRLALPVGKYELIYMALSDIRHQYRAKACNAGSAATP